MLVRDNTSNIKVVPVFKLNHLPNEILATIFLCAASALCELEGARSRPEGQNDHEFVDFRKRHRSDWRMTGKKNPIFLAAVCKRWRAIGFSTPRLWECISPHFKGHGFESILLDEALSRTGQRPLTLLIDRPISTKYNDSIAKVLDAARFSQIIDPMIKSLKEVVHRSKVAHLDLSPNVALSCHILECLESPTIDTSALEQLQVTGEHERAIDITSCPSLTALAVDPRPISRGITFAERHFHNLQFLSVGGSIVCLHDILRTFTALVELTFDVYRNHALTVPMVKEPANSDSFPLVLHNLRTLDIGNYPDFAFTAMIWECVTLPHLRILRINPERHIGGGPPIPQWFRNPRSNSSWLSLQAMLQRSRPPLEHLVIKGVPAGSAFSDQEVLETLTLLPSLKTLTLHSERPLPRDFWYKFCGSRHGPHPQTSDDPVPEMLLPNLECLAVGDIDVICIPMIFFALLTRFQRGFSSSQLQNSNSHESDRATLSEWRRKSRTLQRFQMNFPRKGSLQDESYQILGWLAHIGLVVKEESVGWTTSLVIHTP